LLAINLGEDAETTGAVYGQLTGAFYGEQGTVSMMKTIVRRRTVGTSRLQAENTSGGSWCSLLVLGWEHPIVHWFAEVAGKGVLASGLWYEDRESVSRARQAPKQKEVS
jgi:hypothetical protein